MSYLTRDAILEAPDLSFEDVAVPEWGGVVRVRGLTGAERDAFEASVVERKGRETRMNMANLRARLAALAMVDAEGKRLFNDADVAALGKKSGAALHRVFEVAQRLSGITEADISELEKNSDSGQSEGSTSG